jgi:hypothetical protein
MAKKIKKRTLNEYRQNKDFGYTQPNRVEYDHLDDWVDIKEKQKVNQTDWWARMAGKLDSKRVIDFVNEYSDDAKLGAVIRNYVKQLNS